MNMVLNFSRLNDLSVSATSVDGAQGGSKIKEATFYSEGKKTA
jgi:hypothetical protein